MSSKATGLGRVPANLLALAVAVAFFISAMQWRGRSSS